MGDVGEEQTSVEKEEEKHVVKSEANVAPANSRQGKEEQAIGQKLESHAIEHKVAKIPLRDVKTVPTIERRDITVSLVSARRDMKPWGSSEEDLRGKGKLIVRLDNRIETLAEPLQFRFAANPWRPLKQSQNHYTAILEPQELDHENRLEIVVGAAEIGFIAGPFSYREDYQVSPRQRRCAIY
ncbi:MAG: hypothetical protein GXP26_10600 [Planctomycetes bacterium]|nr:hypothetical protein [Planctomycetota bacterium]